MTYDPYGLYGGLKKTDDPPEERENLYQNWLDEYRRTRAEQTQQRAQPQSWWQYGSYNVYQPQETRQWFGEEQKQDPDIRFEKNMWSLLPFASTSSGMNQYYQDVYNPDKYYTEQERTRYPWDWKASQPQDWWQYGSYDVPYEEKTPAQPVWGQYDPYGLYGVKPTQQQKYDAYLQSLTPEQREMVQNKELVRGLDTQMREYTPLQYDYFENPEKYDNRNFYGITDEQPVGGGGYGGGWSGWNYPSYPRVEYPEQVKSWYENMLQWNVE